MIFVLDRPDSSDLPEKVNEIFAFLDTFVERLCEESDRDRDQLDFGLVFLLEFLHLALLLQQVFPLHRFGLNNKPLQKLLLRFD